MMCPTMMIASRSLLDGGCTFTTTTSGADAIVLVIVLPVQGKLLQQGNVLVVLVWIVLESSQK